jgi:hypothetical protein
MILASPPFLPSRRKALFAHVNHAMVTAELFIMIEARQHLFHILREARGVTDAHADHRFFSHSVQGAWRQGRPPDLSGATRLL